MSLLIRGGCLIDPSQSLNSPHDLWVVNGFVQKILKSGQSPPSRPEKTIDAKNLTVAPGFVDLHTHLRDPGEPQKEDIESGTKAALVGGFTSILCMPNTTPTIDQPKVVLQVLEKVEKSGHCRVYPVGAVTENLQGKKITDMAALKKAGVVAFSDDGRPVNDPRILRQALLQAKNLKSFVIEHCEDLETEGGGCGSESLDAHRAMMLATEVQARLHLAHVSCVQTIRLLREYKKQWNGITSEVTPHHLTLTSLALRDHGANAKMYPPLRENQDVESAREALKDGTIDAIATDHAPHTAQEKSLPFEKAPNGIIGLESAFWLMMGLVSEGILTLDQVVERMSTTPAKIAGIPGGTLRPGSIADLVIFDSKQKRTFGKTDLRSKSANTPFLGVEGRGRVLCNVVGGVIKFTELQ